MTYKTIHSTATIVFHKKQMNNNFEIIRSRDHNRKERNKQPIEMAIIVH